MKKLKEVNLFKISTTAYDEEDFFIVTTLGDKQITQIIEPIVIAERLGADEYDNEYLVEVLRKKYPNEIVQYHHTGNIDEINI